MVVSEINHIPMMCLSHTLFVAAVMAAVAAALQTHAQTPLRTDKSVVGGKWLEGNMFFI